MGYTFSKKKIIRKANPAASVVLRKLRLFLDKNEPQLVYFLTNLWNAQGRAITYKELREAILSGDISAELLEEWQQDYSRFVVEYLQPEWLKAIETSAKEIAAKYPEWNFDPYGDGVRQWTSTRAAEFVTNSTQTQIEAIRAVVQRAAVLEDMNVDVLARAIRPMVGLYKQQAEANMRYYENLIANGVREKKALDLSARYAARQHRYRGYLIARTELATAYNEGVYQGTKQAIEAGYMTGARKVWCTADDERVCKHICLPLDGKPVDLDDDFYYEITDREGNKSMRRINHTLHDDTVGRMPPAHPGCRCAVIIEPID